MEVILLPFLKKKIAPQAGIIVKTRAPDKPDEVEQDQDDSSAAIESCAGELIRAIQANDVKGAAMALKDAFDILESMPHDEAEPHSYDSQNAIAAKDQD